MYAPVVDYGNEIEMRALYERQRHIIPFFKILSVVFVALSIVLSLPRWMGQKQTSENLDLLCMGAAIVFTLCAEWEKRTTFKQWMENMPKVSRIAVD
jgi:hypothetical protein